LDRYQTGERVIAYKPPVLRPHGLVPVFQPGLGLFRTCQPLHHEAATVLYSGNTITAVQVEPFVEGLSEWLCKVGAHGLLLKHWTIGLDGICQQHCDQALDYFKIYES
jgi:hypothetical protein